VALFGQGVVRHGPIARRGWRLDGKIIRNVYRDPIEAMEEGPCRPPCAKAARWRSKSTPRRISGRERSPHSWPRSTPTIRECRSPGSTTRGAGAMRRKARLRTCQPATILEKLYATATEERRAGRIDEAAYAGTVRSYARRAINAHSSPHGIMRSISVRNFSRRVVFAVLLKACAQCHLLAHRRPRLYSVRLPIRSRFCRSSLSQVPAVRSAILQASKELKKHLQ
jgi:hypothetical protein